MTSSSSSTSLKVHYIYDGKERVPKEATLVSFDQSITEIGDYAFKDCTSLTTITIPEPIVRIGNYAFYDCQNLRSIILPQSLKDIGNAAFDGCASLTSIIIPQAVTKIRYRAFYRCHNLISVFLPELTIQDIRNNAFSECEALSLICIPSSVKTVLYSAFNDCDTLRNGLSNSQKFVVRNSSDDSTAVSLDIRTSHHEVKFFDDVESWLQGRFNHLPLHQLCYFYDHSNSLIGSKANSDDNYHVNDKDLYSNKNVAGKVNDLPSLSSSAMKIKKMIKNHPETILSTDALDMTPLHILICRCYHGVVNTKNRIEMLEIMNEMLDLHPELANVKNHQGMTPLDLFYKCHSDGYLPLCISLKLGMKWDQIQKMIHLNQNAVLERGLEQLKNEVYSNSVIGDIQTFDSDLYPFMQAAVQGDLESTYQLALYRIDLM